MNKVQERLGDGTKEVVESENNSDSDLYEPSEQ